MANLGNGPVAMISGLVVAAAAAGAAFFAFDDAALVQEPAAASDAETAPAEAAPPAEREAAREIALAQNEAPPADDAPRAAAEPASLDFTIGSIADLRGEPVSSLMEKIDSLPDVADRTKVWVASADVCSAPGVETFYHVKGPVTCGRIGCDLVVIGEVGGARKVLLETVGEDVSSPQANTLVINAGGPAAVTWVFDGATFVEQR